MWFLLSCCLTYSQRSQIGCPPYFHTMCPYCKFRMHIWNVLHAARWKYRMQKIVICITLSRYIFATKALLTIRKKPVKQQYLLHMSLQYELWPTNGWDQLACFGHPSKFQGFWRFAFAAAPTSLDGGQPNFARCLAVSWAGTLYIHFRVLLYLNVASKSCVLLEVTGQLAD